MAAGTVSLMLYCLQEEKPLDSIQRMESHFFIMLLDQLFLQVSSWTGTLPHPARNTSLAPASCAFGIVHGCQGSESASMGHCVAV